MIKSFQPLVVTAVRQQFCRYSSLNNEAVERKRPHRPVLLNESVDALQIQPNATYVDMTFGAGGHSLEMLERGARVIAIDRDPSVAQFATPLAEKFRDHFDFEVAKFTDIRGVLTNHGVKIGSVSGVLFDCGCSSMQMDQPRGFATSINAPLDMRMNPLEKDSPTAAALVNVLDHDSLAKILKVYGGEKNAKKIAQAIVDYRYTMKRIRTTEELAGIVEAAFSEGHIRKDSLGRVTSLATKTFMALRIFVNDELNELDRGLRLCHQILGERGRASVITFHSLEDKIVKSQFHGTDLNEPMSQSISQKFKNATVWATETPKTWMTVPPKILTPTIDEIEMNPRSRSAKLRVAEKI